MVHYIQKTVMILFESLALSIYFFLILLLLCGLGSYRGLFYLAVILIRLQVTILAKNQNQNLVCWIFVDVYVCRKARKSHVSVI